MLRCANGHKVGDASFKFCPTCGATIEPVGETVATSATTAEVESFDDVFASIRARAADDEPKPRDSPSGDPPAAAPRAIARPPVPASARPVVARLTEKQAMIGTVGGLLLTTIGVFGPWITTIGLINVSVNGVASWDTDGWAFLIGVGLASVALYRYYMKRSDRALHATTLLGFIGTVGAIIEMVRFQRAASSANDGEQLAILSVGWGLYVLVLGAIAVAVGSILIRRTATRT
jgi:hypothetical protein